MGYLGLLQQLMSQNPQVAGGALQQVAGGIPPLGGAPAAGNSPGQLPWTPSQQTAMGYIPPAPGAITDYGGPGQYASPLAAAQGGGMPAAPIAPAALPWTEEQRQRMGYLPPAPGTQQDWGGPGQFASPQAAAPPGALSGSPYIPTQANPMQGYSLPSPNTSSGSPWGT